MPPNSSELISAVGHPLRRRILHAYLDGHDGASAGELAEVLGQRVGQVAYHLKALANTEILRPLPRGAGTEAGQRHYGWALGVEPVWLQLMLEVWTEAELPS